MMTPAELEAAYNLQVGRAFPVADCRYLKKTCSKSTKDFEADLQQFFADVNGFASSATRLLRRTRDQLDRGIETLSLSFFERFPEHGVFRDAITLMTTPYLSAQIDLYEEQRKSLLILLKRVIWLGR